jgi:hypothetical protein
VIGDWRLEIGDIISDIRISIRRYLEVCIIIAGHEMIRSPGGLGSGALICYAINLLVEFYEILYNRVAISYCTAFV